MPSVDNLLRVASAESESKQLTMGRNLPKGYLLESPCVQAGRCAGAAVGIRLSAVGRINANEMETRAMRGGDASPEVLRYL